MIWTTTATIERPSTAGDPYEAATTAVVAAGVRAHVSAPSGSDRAVGGDMEVITATCYLPAGTDVAHYDRITDDGTSTTYDVVWVRQRQGLGLDHVVAGVRVVQGGAS